MQIDIGINTSIEEQMLAKKVWAIIGANQNSEKFGNMIYKKMKHKNYKVFAINPRYQSIDGDPCFASLTDLPEKPDVINVVVSPAIAKPFLKEAAELGIKNIWFQPGTYDESVMVLINELGLTAVQACVLVATR